MALTQGEQRYWQAYLDGLRVFERPEAPVVTSGFAGDPQTTDGLLGLYLEGTKTAGSSLLEDFLAAGDPIPQVGDHWIILGSDGEPGCIARTVRVELHPFQDVPEDIAVAEGEGDLSVAHWRRAHAERYTPHLAEWGLSAIDEATVVTEFFEIVFRGPAGNGWRGNS